ncbi:MAG: hypothetical protein KDA51_08750, partial [Planctomycetales bacterium]|nr:hypothetical protein [Planctomycetales bacterium]
HLLTRVRSAEVNWSSAVRANSMRRVHPMVTADCTDGSEPKQQADWSDERANSGSIDTIVPPDVRFASWRTNVKEFV